MSNIIQLRMILTTKDLFEIRLFDFPKTNPNSKVPVSLYSSDIYMGAFCSIEDAEHYIRTGEGTYGKVIEIEDVFFASTKPRRNS